MFRPVRDPVTGKVSGDPGEMMQKRALAIHMIYPQITELRGLVYSASGHNKGKDMLKSSFHLVWPQLMVDPDRAPVIRHVTLGLFQKETLQRGTFLNKLQSKLIDLHDSNSWELVFDCTTINARNGLRMPYNDKASMVVESEDDKRKIKEGSLSKTKAFKKRVREGRPSKAIGTILFKFDTDPTTGESRMVSSQWVADEQSHTIADWIGMGTCRRDPDDPKAELTPWQLGPDVLQMLPTKPGEKFYVEGEDDGEGGHWVTHKPFPQIRRCPLTTQEFQRTFDDALMDERHALEEEHRLDLVRKMLGSWLSVTDNQAIWRATCGSQCENVEQKALDSAWGYGRMKRPTEVIFLKRKNKVVVDGPQDVVDALIRALKTFTKPDDNAVKPIYDVVKMGA